MTDTATRDSDTTGHDTRDTGHATERDTTTRDSATDTTDTTDSHDTATPTAWERIATYGQYVPIPRRTLVVALYDGSVDGGTRLWEWATEKGWESLKTRGSAIGGGAVVTIYTIATTPPPVNGFLTVGATATWVTWALLSAPSPAEKKRRAQESAEAAARAAEQKAAEKAAKKARRWGAKNAEPPLNEGTQETPRDEGPQDAPNNPASECKINTRTDLLNWLRDAIADRNGIHLDELHHRLSAEPGFTTLDRTHVTPLLNRHHIPIHRAISVDGIAGRTGVKQGDIKALLKDSPQEDPPTPAGTD